MQKKIMEHALMLCSMVDVNTMIYGDALVEFGERSIEIINPYVKYPEAIYKI